MGINHINTLPPSTAATAYANARIPIIPLHTPTPDTPCDCTLGGDCPTPAAHPRHPATDATTDPGQIRTWWRQHPTAGIAIPTGAPSGLDAITTTSPDGHDTLTGILDGTATLTAAASEATTVIIQHTPGAATVRDWLPGLDYHAAGHYLIAPPTPAADGVRWQWTNPAAPATPGPGITRLIDTRTGPPDYDYETAKTLGPHPEHAPEFFDRYTYELRRRGWDRHTATHTLRQLWEHTYSDTVTDDPHPWETIIDTIDHTWTHVQPDPEGHEPAPAEHTHPTPRSRTTSITEADPEPGSELATELGTAARYARVNTGHLTYIPTLGWAAWTGTHWSIDTTGTAPIDGMRRTITDLRNTAGNSPHHDAQRWNKWALTCENAHRMDAIIRLASRHPGMITHQHDLDATPHLLNTPAGTYNLHTRRLQPHDPADLITLITTATPDPDTTSPTLADYHDTFLPDPTIRDYLYRAVGAALQAGNRDRHLIIITGPTTTGKTTWTTLTAHALGTYAAPTGPSIWRTTITDRPRPDLLRIMRRRLIITEETSHRSRLDTDQIKRATGGVPQTARSMGSDHIVERVPDFTPIIVTNQLPHIPAADSAVQRRLIAIPFTHQPDIEDPDAKHRLLGDPDAATEILTRLIAGCHDTQRHGLDLMPPAVADCTRRTFEDLDHVGAFIKQLTDTGRLVADPQIPALRAVSGPDLYSEYQIWLEMYGSDHDRRHRLGIKHFNERLRSLGWVSANVRGIKWTGYRLEWPDHEHEGVT